MFQRRAVERERTLAKVQTKLEREDVFMRKTLFLICVLAIPCASWAQGDQASWTNLSILHPGQKIQVVETNSKKHSGTFVSFSEASIVYQDAAGGQTIPRQDVRRVKLSENKHHLRNALIGGAVGAGVGAGIGAAAKPSCTGNDCINIIGKGAVAGIGAVVGFGAGVLVGVFLPSHQTVYSVKSN
jgi:hypothetical protein